MPRNEQIQVLTVDCRTYLSLSGVNLNADVVPEERDGIVWEKSVLLEIVDEFLFGVETSFEDSARKDITNFHRLIQIFGYQLQVDTNIS